MGGWCSGRDCSYRGRQVVELHLYTIAKPCCQKICVGVGLVVGEGEVRKIDRVPICKRKFFVF